jgi:hypothetical protein
MSDAMRDPRRAMQQACIDRFWKLRIHAALGATTTLE